MATPEVSIDERLEGRGYEQRIYFDGRPPDPATPAGYPLWRRKTEYRPASTSSPKNSSGWRVPTRFWHYGSYSTPCPTTAFGLSESYNPDSVLVLGDGRGWNQTVFGLQALPDYLEDAAVSKALLGLKNQKVNLSQAFAERGQLVGLTLSAVEKTASLMQGFLRKRREISRGEFFAMTVKDLKRGLRKKNTQGLLKDFLEVQYGVRPLMQDVYGASDALNKRERDGDAYRATVHGRARQVMNHKWFKQSDYTGSFGYDCDVSESHLAHVRLDYVLDNPLLASLAQLGITNPIDLAWEELPFSFVVDWFLPVGNYLESLDAALGWSFKGGTLSCISRNKVSGDVPTLRDDYWKFLYLPSYSPYRESNYHFERYVYTSSPLPRIPRFKNPFSGQHIANAIALVFARIR